MMDEAQGRGGYETKLADRSQNIQSCHTSEVRCMCMGFFIKALTHHYLLMIAPLSLVQIGRAHV